MKNKRDSVPYASKRELVLSIALGCLNIAIFGILAQFIDFNQAVLALAVAVLYLMEIALIGLLRRKRMVSMPEANIWGLLSERGSVVLQNTTSPVAAFDDDGTLLWCNDAMLGIISGDENPVGKNIHTIFGTGLSVKNISTSELVLGDRIYYCESFFVNGYEEGKEENGINLLALTDITALSEMEKKYNDSKVCVAYIAIDNVEDILQYVQEKFRDAVSTIDDKLKTWAASMNAIIKSYDNDKYIMFLDSVALDECIGNRFAILDEIRDSRVGDGVSITVSIGIARTEGTLSDRELAARDAIDMALQRGGDQVVYYNNGATEFYGGRTKSVYKRSNVRSRTFTNQLSALIARSDNVVIMGHRYGDFDSFGASIGIAKIAMLSGVKANIAVDLRDQNLAPCLALMQELDEYSQVFVDNADGLDLVGPDTLLVLVDHNTTTRAQFADIAEKVGTIVVVDHHRKIDALDEAVKLSYIEPSASSTCELVTEMLEGAMSSQNLSKAEADMLLAGILLDTKQFTRNTGTRTFGAAQYLRGAGANPGDVYSFFKSAADDLRKESMFHTAITTYRGNIAISSCDGDADESYRVIASKAADKMLTLQGIEAAFTLVRIGEQIHISGRSNGNINVQLILEELKGGGHFDVAGAQVHSDSVLEVLEKLKGAIDSYLDA